MLTIPNHWVITINHIITAHHLSTSEWLLPTRQRVANPTQEWRREFLHCLWECNNVWTECLLRKLKVALPSDPTILTRAYPSGKNNLLKEEPAFSYLLQRVYNSQRVKSASILINREMRKENVKFICVFVWILFNHIKDEILCMQQQKEKWQILSETNHLEQDLYHKVSLICGIWTELNLN